MTALPKLRPVIPAAAPPPATPRVEKQSTGNQLSREERYRVKKEVMGMSRKGHSLDEIAATLGITAQWASSILIRNNMGSGRRGATRRIEAFIPARYYRNLKLAAEEDGKSPSAAVAHLLKGLLADVPTARKGLRGK